jgi:ABC-type phosphate transport system substrate-binding protein
VVPVDQSAQLSTQVVAVPFKFVLGNGVKRVDPVSGSLLDVDSLSRSKIEALLSRQVTDWRQLGLVADADADGIPDSEAPVVLCLQQAGSGDKAALDATLMKDAAEFPSGLAPSALNHTHTTGTGQIHFGLNGMDVRDCIGGNAALNRPAHPTAIGYMSADAVVPNGYGVGIDGRQARDLALPDPKANVKCGKYPFWTGLRLNTRNPSDSDAAIAALIYDFITEAGDPATIALMSTANYWMSEREMYVFKNADHGPLIWKPLSVLPPGQVRFPCGE